MQISVGDAGVQGRVERSFEQGQFTDYCRVAPFQGDNLPVSPFLCPFLLMFEGDTLQFLRAAHQ